MGFTIITVDTPPAVGQQMPPEKMVHTNYFPVVDAPMKTKMTMEHHHFLLGDTSSFIVGFSSVMSVFCFFSNFFQG